MSSAALLFKLNTVFCNCKAPQEVAVMRLTAYSTVLEGSMVDLNKTKQKQLYNSVLIKSVTVSIIMGNH
jgi:hypothetical protein